MYLLLRRLYCGWKRNSIIFAELSKHICQGFLFIKVCQHFRVVHLFPYQNLSLIRGLTRTWRAGLCSNSQNLPCAGPCFFILQLYGLPECWDIMFINYWSFYLAILQNRISSMDSSTRLRRRTEIRGRGVLTLQSSMPPPPLPATTNSCCRGKVIQLVWWCETVLLSRKYYAEIFLHAVLFVCRGKEKNCVCFDKRLPKC